MSKALDRRLVYIAAAAAIAVIGGVAVWWLALRPAPTSYVTAPVARGDVATTITASGTVNPVTTVQVGTYVSGTIVSLTCDFNTRVTKGQLCAKIDPAPYQMVPHNALGQLDRDYRNPNPALRTRELCGLVILWNLHPAGPNRWKDGWFYNPDDGGTYRVSAQLKSDDVIEARIYLGIPLFGQTKTLVRVPHGVSEGWC